MMAYLQENDSQQICLRQKEREVLGKRMYRKIKKMV